MPVLSNTSLLVRLPYGGHAVYSVQPQHMNINPDVLDLPTRAMRYGTQLAYEQQGQWYHPDGEQITDLRTIALLERCPEA
jgi:hypothetical protein